MECPGPYGLTDRDYRELEQKYYKYFGETISLPTGDYEAYCLAFDAIGYAFYCLPEDIIDAARRELREYLEAKRGRG